MKGMHEELNENNRKLVMWEKNIDFNYMQKTSDTLKMPQDEDSLPQFFQLTNSIVCLLFCKKGVSSVTVVFSRDASLIWVVVAGKCRYNMECLEEETWGSSSCGSFNRLDWHPLLAHPVSIIRVTVIWASSPFYASCCVKAIWLHEQHVIQSYTMVLQLSPEKLNIFTQLLVRIFLPSLSLSLSLSLRGIFCQVYSLLYRQYITQNVQYALGLHFWAFTEKMPKEISSRKSRYCMSG